MLKKLFKLSSSFSVKYYDDENDQINIRSDLDLETAIGQSKDKVLRLLLVEDISNERDPKCKYQ